MSSKKVLIVDDNKSIRTEISKYLNGEGYEVIEAADGIQGLERCLSSSPNLILLDVVMPGIDGFKLCQMFRQKGLQTPIILLTEKSDIQDKVTGFSCGADDYLAKPFNTLELGVRIQAILRRTSIVHNYQHQKIIKHGDFEIDLDRHSVIVNGKEISLTPIEFNIVKLLASTPGYVYSRNDLLNTIWDTGYEGYKRNIDPHVNRLRTKIEDNPKKPKYILTVWGVGYKFNDSLTEM